MMASFVPRLQAILEPLSAHDFEPRFVGSLCAGGSSPQSLQSPRDAQLPDGVERIVDRFLPVVCCPARRLRIVDGDTNELRVRFFRKLGSSGGRLLGVDD